MFPGGCGPVGAGHTNGATQIHSLRFGMTNKERVVVRKGRLLEERLLKQRFLPTCGKTHAEAYREVVGVEGMFFEARAAASSTVDTGALRSVSGRLLP